MLKNAVEFGDCRQMTLLSCGARVGLLGEGMDAWQVVCMDGEGRLFGEMAGVTDGSMDGEQLPVKGGVARLGGESFLLKKARSCLAPWRTCSRMAPMAMSLASVERTRGRPGVGNLR